MKKMLTIAGLFLLVSTLLVQAQAPAILTITNGSNIETVSNGVVIATTPIVTPTAAAFSVASSLGIPDWVVSLIPLKYIPWIALLLWLLPYAGRAWHAYQQDGGAKGIAAAVAFGTNVPVALKVQSTGQPVVPTVPVNPGTPPKV
jgi:hypothetical protein